MTTTFRMRLTSIADLCVLDRSFDRDGRGYLERLFDLDELGWLLGDRAVLQINRSVTSRRGTVRGLHFQVPPHAEMKFVTCLRGSVYDVAVDVRRDSATFLGWHGEVLRETEPTTLIVPEGFAHGFQTLTDDVELLYFHTAAYEPSAEGGLNPMDPRLAIDWPEEIAEISARDELQPMLPGDYQGYVQ